MDAGDTGREGSEQMKPTLIISDCHAPYHHQDTIPFLCSVREHFKTEQAIHVGDETDQHALSYHESDPDASSDGDELEAAIAFIRPMHRAFPKMRLCESNHGSLMYRKAKTHGISAKRLKSLDEIYGISGWSWHEEITDEIKPGLGVCVRHSFGINVSTALPRQGGVCIVQGHHHGKLNVEYLQTPTVRLFGMTVGCLIDGKARTFAYNRLQQTRPILGCGVIVKGMAIAVPMWTGADGRWTGKVSL